MVPLLLPAKAREAAFYFYPQFINSLLIPAQKGIY
jgi:hypothetical protein